MITSVRLVKNGKYWSLEKLENSLNKLLLLASSEYFI